MQSRKAFWCLRFALSRGSRLAPPKGSVFKPWRVRGEHLITMRDVEHPGWFGDQAAAPLGARRLSGSAWGSVHEQTALQRGGVPGEPSRPDVIDTVAASSDRCAFLSRRGSSPRPPIGGRGAGGRSQRPALAEEGEVGTLPARSRGTSRVLAVVPLLRPQGSAPDPGIRNQGSERDQNCASCLRQGVRSSRQRFLISDH